MILRIAAGSTLAAQGILFLSSCPHLTTKPLAAGVLAAATGVFLLLGFLTPIFSSLACVEYLAIGVFGACPPESLLNSKFLVVQVMAILVALAFLGPGAFSVDARLFGWKEIVIPAAPQKREE